MSRRWNTPRVTRSDPIRVLYVEDDERLARLTLEYLTSHEPCPVVTVAGANPQTSFP